MTQVLMPLATAVWLVENTTLTFSQIAEFCDLHEMEVQSIADGEIAHGIVGANPILNGQITEDNLDECQKDPKKKLELLETEAIKKTASRKYRYIPIAKRRDKPDAIAWIIRHYPEIPDIKIVKLIGTTKKTIEAIRNRTHANIIAIQPKDPVLLGLCSQTDLDKLIETFSKKPEELEPEESNA